MKNAVAPAGRSLGQFVDDSTSVVSTVGIQLRRKAHCRAVVVVSPCRETAVGVDAVVRNAAKRMQHGLLPPASCFDQLESHAASKIAALARRTEEMPRFGKNDGRLGKLPIVTALEYINLVFLPARSLLQRKNGTAARGAALRGSAINVPGRVQRHASEGLQAIWASSTGIKRVQYSLGPVSIPIWREFEYCPACVAGPIERRAVEIARRIHGQARRGG